MIIMPIKSKHLRSCWRQPRNREAAGKQPHPIPPHQATHRARANELRNQLFALCEPAERSAKPGAISTRNTRERRRNDARRRRSVDREDPAAGSILGKLNRRGRGEKCTSRPRLVFRTHAELQNHRVKFLIFHQNPRKASTNARRRTGALREVFVRFNDAPTSQ
jgi:hypothetical protein